MRKSAKILGIIGGIIGLVVGIVASLIATMVTSFISGLGFLIPFLGLLTGIDIAGMAASFTAAAVALIILSILGILGGALSGRKPKVSGSFMLIAGIGGFLALWGATPAILSGQVSLPLIWLLPGILLVIGSILAFAGYRKIHSEYEFLPRYDRSAMRFCRNCGIKIDTNDRFCSSCGTHIPEAFETPDQMVSPEAPWTAKCPVCKSGSLNPVAERRLSGGKGVTEHFRCNNCDAFFMSNHIGYKLTGCRDKSLRVWHEYRNRTLTTEEWQRIAYGILSEVHLYDIEETDISPKSRLAATLLAVFIGSFGAHRFYVGKTGSAVAMLLLGIFGILFIFFFGLGIILIIAVGIWAFVDFIIAVTGNMRDAYGRLIKKW